MISINVALLWPCVQLFWAGARSDPRLGTVHLGGALHLHDIKFSGPPWTYDNKRKGSKNVKARIDRALGSPSWSNLYPEAFLSHVCSTRSDHMPLVLDCDNSTSRHKPENIFRYEHMWEREASVAPRSS